MEDVSKQEGRTVLFVSHNTGIVAQLCTEAILLERGRVALLGRTREVVDAYVTRHEEKIEAIEKAELLPGANQFSSIWLADREGARRSQYQYDEEILVEVGLQLENFVEDVELALRLIDRHKNPIFTIAERLEPFYRATGKSLRLRIAIPPAFITPGKYSWVIAIHQPNVTVHEVHDDVLPFFVLETGSDFAKYGTANYGSVFARYSVEEIVPQLKLKTSDG
jgi:lipopolysaccharide transport system ATP-binding protein